MNPELALIDADSIIHIVAYHHKIPEAFFENLVIRQDENGVEDPLDKRDQVDMIYKETQEQNIPTVLAHVDQFVNDIINKAGVQWYIGFLGNRLREVKTFRHALAKTKPYKGQRPASPPWTRYWKPIIMDHLIGKWKFIELSNIEADDAVAILQTLYKDKSIICGIDKDLRQIPGNHYNYKTQNLSYVEEPEALRSLYTQCMVGDSSDNISGCPGIGAKSKLLNQLDKLYDMKSMHQYAFECFQKKGHPELMAEMLQLVFLIRKPDGIDILEGQYPAPQHYISSAPEVEALFSQR